MLRLLDPTYSVETIFQIKITVAEPKKQNRSGEELNKPYDRAITKNAFDCDTSSKWERARTLVSCLGFATFTTERSLSSWLLSFFPYYFFLHNNLREWERYCFRGALCVYLPLWLIFSARARCGCRWKHTILPRYFFRSIILPLRTLSRRNCYSPSSGDRSGGRSGGYMYVLNRRACVTTRWSKRGRFLFTLLFGGETRLMHWRCFKIRSSSRRRL